MANNQFSVVGKMKCSVPAGCRVGTGIKASPSKQPGFTMTGRNFPPVNKFCTPGPAAYMPLAPRAAPGGVPFGKRTPARPYVTAEEHAPSVIKQTRSKFAKRK